MESVLGLVALACGLIVGLGGVYLVAAVTEIKVSGL